LQLSLRVQHTMMCRRAGHTRGSFMWCASPKDHRIPDHVAPARNATRSPTPDSHNRSDCPDADHIQLLLSGAGHSPTRCQRMLCRAPSCRSTMQHRTELTPRWHVPHTSASQHSAGSLASHPLLPRTYPFAPQTEHPSAPFPRPPCPARHLTPHIPSNTPRKYPSIWQQCAALPTHMQHAASALSGCANPCFHPHHAEKGFSRPSALLNAACTIGTAIAAPSTPSDPPLAAACPLGALSSCVSAAASAPILLSTAISSSN